MSGSFHNEQFDILVPLGLDSRVSQVLRQLRYPKKPMPFDDIISPITFLQDFFSRDLKDQFSSNLADAGNGKVRDNGTGAVYINAFDTSRPLIQQLNDVRSEYAIRSTRLRDALTSDLRICFIRCLEDSSEIGQAGDISAINELSACITQNYPNAKFCIWLLYNSAKTHEPQSDVVLMRLPPDKIEFKKKLDRHIDKLLENQNNLRHVQRFVVPDKVPFDSPKAEPADLKSLKIESGKHLYAVKQEGVLFDFFADIKPSDTLIVFGQSAVNRSNKPTLPFFNRWSWSDQFSASCMYLNDPTLYLDEGVECAWMTGTRDHYYLETFSQIVRIVSKQINVAPEKILFFGSSAGGFTSMMMAADLKGSHAVVEIPQTHLPTYHHKHDLDRMLSFCYGGLNMQQAYLQFPERLSVIDRFRLRRHIPNILYMQNTEDTSHMETQTRAFMNGVIDLMRDIPSTRDAKIIMSYHALLHPIRGGHTVQDNETVISMIKMALSKFTKA